MNTLILIIHLIFIQNTHSFEQIQDITKCKLTHLGLSYQGTKSKTEGGALCQSWATKKPIHKTDPTIINESFLEKSKTNAKNYCRNPNRNELGPWCYTMDPELIDDTCDIPLCNYPECKLSGPGMEYAGQHHKSVSDKNCLKWDKHRSKVRNISGDMYEQEKFSKRRFPDETRGDASKYCRNPDGDIGGPWCFVKAKEGRGVVEKQYCDIPVCDVENCVTFTRDTNIYSHYSLINGTLSELNFGLKIWHPDHEIEEYNARLLLSLFALPLTGDEIDDLQIGIEIFISQNESALTVGNKDDPEFEPLDNVIKSSSFTYFSLNWNSGFITLSLLDAKHPIFLAEYRWRKDLFKLNPNKFFYYSIQGRNMLWSLPFCDDDYECEIHKTTSLNFERFWPLRHTNASHDLKFYIRAFHSATIKFQYCAVVDYPNIILTLSRKNDNHTTIILNTDKNGQIELKSVTVLQLFSYWEWRQFLVTFFSDTIQVYWERDIGTQLIIEAKHEYISQIRWFSPASVDNLAEWTFFCTAPELSEPPKPWPPECVLNKDEINYEGTQSITRKGHPCVPWIYDKNVLNINKDLVLKSWNYCRDISSEKSGTYCYAISQTPKIKISKEKCLLRMCRSSECRMAGTGNDYIGPVNTTRSNRTCQYWTENSPHLIKTEFLNGSLFPDQDHKNAENFCRDPSRNIAGPWCYTTDAAVMWDLCNVRDCTYAEECIIMTRGSGEGRFIYILPEWKDSAFGGGLHFALKEWDPDKLDGIMFDVMPLDSGTGFLRLIIGADDNERIVVFYSKTNGTSSEVVKEKSMPHLIPAGKWTAFWLQIRKGEIFFGYEGASEPLFTWEHDNKESAFEPVFMTYMSIQNNVIGVHFKCTECHTERTTTKSVTRIMPINLWQETEMNTFQNLSIFARGSGVLLIPFLQMPLSGDYYAAAIGDKGTYIMFIKNKIDRAATLQMIDLQKPVLDTHEWTHYFFQFDEKNIEIFRNNLSVLQYTTRKTFLFYWFSVTVEEGWIEWAANCQPPDIDGDPIDGGWSEWSPFHCTVTCGGGTGIRYRSCTNPKPNIRGAICKGPHSDTGSCNEFDCGDLSPTTLEVIRQQLKKKHYSFTLSETEDVLIENDAELLEIVRKESPKSSYQWTRNGVYLNEVPGQIEFENDNVKINSAQSKRDSGIYICMLHRIHGERVVLRVVTIAIISQLNQIEIRETLDMTLECNGASLGYVYMDLAQAWLLNGKVVIDYGITTLAAVITEKVVYVGLNYSGDWSCRITQPDLKFTWIIKIIKVHIKNRPSWITHLMEDQFTKPIFGKFNERNVVFVLIGMVVSIFGFVFSCLIVYLKCSSLPKLPYNKIKTNT